MTAHPFADQSLNMTMLARLREAEGEYVALDSLGPDLSQTGRALTALEDFGFEIEHHPLLGAAYRGPADRLCPDQIEFQLGTREIGRRIAVWDRVTSTNDLAARGSRSPANHGLVVLAEDQSAGRGRQGRTWAAPARSSILMSILLFPPPRLTIFHGPNANGNAWLTALAAVAVSETVSKQLAKQARVKWPNDVRVAGRKIAGILVEQPAVFRAPGATTTNVDGPPKPVVIGIGLNVNLERDSLPESLRNSATSMLMECRSFRKIDRSELARSLIQNLDRWYCACLDQGPSSLSTAWTKASELYERVVRVETLDGGLVGRLRQLDLENGLRLELEDPTRSEIWVALSRIRSLGVEPPDSGMGSSVCGSNACDSRSAGV